jgi:putative ABC transport system substrate-binding protein
MPQIGFLVATDKKTWKKYISAFENRLTALDWNITANPQAANDVKIVYSEALGKPANFLPMATAFVTTPVDIIVTSGTAPARTCKDATAAANPPGSIPVVFASAGDPVGSGLVTSLKKPGGNVTGGYNQQMNLVFKRVEELREQWVRAHPGKPLSQLNLGVIGTGLSNSPGATEMTIVEKAASVYGLTCQPHVQIDPNNAPNDIPVRIQNLRTAGVNVLYVCSDPVITSNADAIASACKTGAPIETMHQFREYRQNHGGTWSYGASFTEMFAKAADYVDQILRAPNPAQFAGTLPVFEPNTVESVPPWS